MALEYSVLREEVVKGVGLCPGYANLLSSLKEFYKADINSCRRFEKISTISDLLKLLEIRNILSADNVEPLKEVARRVSSTNNLEMIITNYEKKTPPKGNLNHLQAVATPVTPIQVIQTLYQNPYGGKMSEEKKNMIKEIIIERIGRSWREVAINLGIRQCSINNIKNNYVDYPSQAKEMLEFYEQNRRVDPQYWYINICKALDKSNRPDIILLLNDVAVRIDL